MTFWKCLLNRWLVRSSKQQDAAETLHPTTEALDAAMRTLISQIIDPPTPIARCILPRRRYARHKMCQVVMSSDKFVPARRDGHPDLQIIISALPAAYMQFETCFHAEVRRLLALHIHETFGTATPENWLILAEILAFRHNVPVDTYYPPCSPPQRPISCYNFSRPFWNPSLNLEQRTTP